MHKEMNTAHLGRILVVDDTPANLQLLTNLLTAHGYTVHPASDGEVALEFVRSILPDLILLDIRMPEMDGYEVCRRLKADERTRSIPIIFISILEDERDKAKGFQAGAVDYVAKPFQAEEVLGRVRIHLHLRELTEHLEQKVAEQTEALHAANAQLQRELAERRQAETELKRIEWMLSKKHTVLEGRESVLDQGYGDLTALNHDGLILKSVDRDVLRSIAADYLDLLGTFSAIYEVNGDYAFGIFTSNWYRMLDLASRKLCDTDDDAAALSSGQWLCHESCWTRCSKETIATRAPMDIACSGGIRLYDVPIVAHETVIGSINFGYGDAPNDPVKLRALASVYHLDYEDLLAAADAYDSRPSYIIEMAKSRLHASAKLIGIMVERKQAEEEVRQLNLELDRRVLERTAELEAANKDMHAFTYSVSHDLRAPLRHIDGFMELLQKKAGTALDEQSRHYMKAISEAGKKMGLLIDDLLSFSHMGRHAMRFQAVDLGPLVRDVIRELAPDAGGRNIEWRMDDLPTVGGDAAMLRLVLDNLIANSLKFTRPLQQAQIEIGSLPDEDPETVIFVRDNGVGSDMTYADKLFGVFQRLHRAEEFEAPVSALPTCTASSPGTGVGPGPREKLTGVPRFVIHCRDRFKEHKRVSTQN